MTMRLIGQLLLVATVAALIAAIWIPDHRWQSAATAFVLLFVGAAVLGQTNKTTRKDP